MDKRRLNTAEWSRINLSSVQVARIEEKIDSSAVYTVSPTKQSTKLPKQSTKLRAPVSLKSIGFVVIGVCAASLVLVGGRLGYKAVTLTQTSSQTLHHKSSPAANSTHPKPAESVQTYYNKTLGFRPMLPSYIPSGMKISISRMNIERSYVRDFSGFSITLADKNRKHFQIGIEEESLAQYKQSASRVYKVTHKSTIHRDGQTITMYKWPQAYGGGAAVELDKGGVSYAVECFSKGGYTIDELVKILESINVPEKDKPTSSFILVNGSIKDVSKMVRFKAIVPTFVPKGYKVLKSKQGLGSPLARTMGGTSGVFSQFSVAYRNGKADIGINEEYGGNLNFKDLIRPNSTSETIKGQQVYVYEETQKLQGRTKSFLKYTWKNPATNVIYTVSGSNPSTQPVAEKAMLKKVVASMLK